MTRFARPERRTTGAVFAAFALSGALASSCATLPEIGAGECGNGVKEGTEDCDTFPNDPNGKVQCGAAGTTNACRYLASVEDCPAGYIGGVDGVCRVPTNRFRDAFQLPGVQGVRAEVVDFDGDSVGDITLLSSDRARRDVVYSESSALASGQALATVSLATSPIHSSAIADMNGDRLPDIVQPGNLGMSVLLSRPERDFVPFVFEQFKGSNAFAVEIPSSVRLGVGTDFAMPPGLVISNPTAGVVLCYDALQCKDPSQFVVLDPPGPFDAHAAIAFFADLDGAGPPDLVYAQRGADHVIVITYGALGIASRSVVTLPPTQTIEETVAAADIDGDGRLDLLTSSSKGPKDVSHFLRKLGPIAGPLSSFDLAQPDPLESPLLAAGDVNGDGFADYVTGFALYESYPAGPPMSPTTGYFPVATPTGYQSWTSALIGDLDADGRPDVAAIGPTPGIDVFLGTHSFGTTAVRLSAEVGMKTLVRGDIDGDGVGDLVASTVDHPKCNGNQEVLAYFGQAFGPPTGPVRLSEAPGIQQILPLRTPDSLAQVGDAIDDLLVVTAAPTPDGCSTVDGSAGILFGTPDRRPLSVFRMGDPTAMKQNVPFYAVAGDLDGDGISDVLTTASLDATNASASVAQNAVFLFQGVTPKIFPDGQPVGVPVADTLFPDFVSGLTLGDVGPSGHRDFYAFKPRLDVTTCTTGPNSGCDYVLAVDHATYQGAGYQVAPIDVGAPVLLHHFDATQPLSPVKVTSVDLDADGDLDVLGAMMVDDADLPTNGDTVLSAMFVLTNQGGTLTPKRVPLPEGHTIVDFAVAAAPVSLIAKKTVLPPTILVATERKLYALEGDTLRTLATAREVTIGSSQPLSSDAPAQRITSVATGDVDGDGLEDIVLVTSAGVRVLSRMATFDTGALFSLDPNEDVSAP